MRNFRLLCSATMPKPCPALSNLWSCDSLNAGLDFVVGTAMAPKVKTEPYLDSELRELRLHVYDIAHTYMHI